MGQEAGVPGTGIKLGLSGPAELSYARRRDLLCDPGEVTASLWARSLQSEGLGAGLLFPILNTL